MVYGGEPPIYVDAYSCFNAAHSSELFPLPGPATARLIF